MTAETCHHCGRPGFWKIVEIKHPKDYRILCGFCEPIDHYRVKGNKITRLRP